MDAKNYFLLTWIICQDTSGEALYTYGVYGISSWIYWRKKLLRLFCGWGKIPPWHFTEGLITKIALSTSENNRIPRFSSVINQLDAQNFCFTISLFHACTCFEHMCLKHVEAWNKLIVKQKFCASSWLITEINILRYVVSNTTEFQELYLWQLYQQEDF